MSSTTWMMNTPRGQRVSGDLCLGYPAANRSAGSAKLDGANAFVQSTPLVHANDKCHRPFNAAPLHAMHANGSGLLSPLVGHTSPVMDEGYYSALSSMSTTVTGSREHDDSKLFGHASTNADGRDRTGELRVVASSSLDSSSTGQSAFSPVPNRDHRAGTRSAVQANSFWTALSTLRQQLYQNGTTASPLQPPPPPPPVPAPAQTHPVSLHPMLPGNPAGTGPLGYFPAPVLWSSNRPAHNHLCAAYDFIHPYRPEPSGFWCECLMTQLRQEMLGLVDMSMKQFAAYLNHSAAGIQHQQQQQEQQQRPPPPGPVPFCHGQLETNPSNSLRSPTSEHHPLSTMKTGLIPARNIFEPMFARGSDSGTPTKPSTRIPSISKQQPMQSHLQRNQHAQPQQQQQQLHILNRRRRLRIRSTGRRLRIRQPPIEGRTAGPGCSFASEQTRTPRTEADGTLDLRVRRDWVEASNQDHCQNPNESPFHSLDQQDAPGANQTLTLSGTHLKRAKMMFLYARYPNSSVLKTFFPEVIFTRSTTAQIVKWFSNFRTLSTIQGTNPPDCICSFQRTTHGGPVAYMPCGPSFWHSEFFYIQVEKYVRQCKADGMKARDEILITRNHELFRNLETHYNKDGEIETPEAFLHTVQVAVYEFFQAISKGIDRDSSWKKAIYKVIAPLDIPFPEFLKHYV